MKKKSIFLLLPLFIAFVLVTASVCVAKQTGQEMRSRDYGFDKGLMRAEGHGHKPMGHVGSDGYGPRTMGLKGDREQLGREGHWVGWNSYWHEGQFGHEGQWRHGGQWSRRGHWDGWNRYRYHHGHHGHHGSWRWGCHPGSYNWPWCKHGIHHHRYHGYRR